MKTCISKLLTVSGADEMTIIKIKELHLNGDKDK
jgi:hypothetical protein